VRARDWDDYSIGRATTQAHLAALDLVYTGVITSHRAAVAKIGALDPIAQDMLIGQTRILEQHQWFCRAHLEDAAGGLSHAGTSTEVEAATKASNRTRSAGRPRAS
jgi:starvation-inducible DNA-binding protein